MPVCTANKTCYGFKQKIQIKQTANKTAEMPFTVNKYLVTSAVFALILLRYWKNGGGCCLKPKFSYLYCCVRPK